MGSLLNDVATGKPAADLDIGVSPDIHCIIATEQVHSVFQPIIDLNSGGVVAYEALARGPVGPPHSPDRLFAEARAHGRLRDLDLLCRRAAIRGASAAGIRAPLMLFVNVEPGIIDVRQLDELLMLADLAPAGLQLVLEITEREVAARPAELLATVRRLRVAGWRIALDDVGADDMSLAFLPLLRPDIIKLDLQLVQRRPDAKIAEIMSAVNAYAERTGSLVLAEGIEDHRQIEIALALGARLGQGFLFGRPSSTTVPQLKSHSIVLPPLITPREGISPFDCLPASVQLRCSTKQLLIEVSKHLEREAGRLGGTCIVLATFQHARHFTPATARRYRDLAGRVAFVAAIGEGIADEATTGVRGADLRPADPILGEWDIAVLAPHFAAALIARDRQESGPDLDRTFDFALTYDRETVEAAAQVLMTRVRSHGNSSAC